LLAAVGCRATMPASASFASVNIQNHTLEQIRDAAGVVFQADGYRVLVNGDQMRFEREGSRATQMAYGQWVGDGDVIVRVVANIVQLSANSYRLECKAYIVKSPGDPVFEEVIKLNNTRRLPYQDLLDKVAAKLK